MGRVSSILSAMLAAVEIPVERSDEERERERGICAGNIVGMASHGLQHLEDLAVHEAHHCLAKIGTSCVNFLMCNFKTIHIPLYLSLVFGRSKMLWVWLMFK